MNKKLWLWSITAALAGFLFGFDTIVISGAEQTLKRIWDSSEAFHGWVVVSGALWGTVIGAAFAGIPTNRLGRKKTLIWIGILYTLSALGSAMSDDPWTFAAFRFIGGLGVGASTVAAPAYITEISTPKRRGRLVALYQFNIVLGILIAYISNYLISGIGDNAWRFMLGVEAIPAVLYTVWVFTIPKSPRWLLLKGKEEEARKTLAVINPNADVDALVTQLKMDRDSAAKHETIFNSKYRLPLILVILFATFNQFSGINAFLYYAPRIFELAGLGESTALLSSVGIGVTNLLFTLLGMYLIDRSGRKKLMYYGSVGYIISLSLVAMAFYLGWQGMAVPIFLFIFIASHAIGQGAVIWVFISEIFPNHLRASGQSMGSTTHWVWAAFIPAMVPLMIGWIGPGNVFLIFAICMVFQLLFVAFMMPETKGVPLEELSKKLIKNEK